MTDIERLKKINNMAAELKKHRFATSYEDAAMQSEQIFKNEGSAPEVPKPEAPTQETTMNNDQFERFKEDVNKRLATAESQLNTVIEKMNEMIASINKLEEGIPAAPKQEETQTKITKESEAPEPAKEKETEAKPRSGDYKSSDVDINKIFYYGNK